MPAMENAQGTSDLSNFFNNLYCCRHSVGFETLTIVLVGYHAFARSAVHTFYCHTYGFVVLIKECKNNMV